MACQPGCICRILLLQCISVKGWYVATIIAIRAQLDFMIVTSTRPWPQFTNANALESIQLYEHYIRDATIDIVNLWQIIQYGCHTCVHNLHHCRN